MREHDYFAYILTNKNQGVLYVGVTNNLERRMWEHRAGEVQGFTQQYGLRYLVWFEHFRDVNAAIACEKRLKSLTRGKKVALINEMNPHWKDLSEGWPGHPNG